MCVCVYISKPHLALARVLSRERANGIMICVVWVEEVIKTAPYPYVLFQVFKCDIVIIFI